MERRDFMKKAAVGAAAAGAISAPAIAQDKTKLTMVTSWGRGLAGVFDAAQRVADNVNTMSGGTLEIEIKAAGELVGAFEVFDAVSSGQADMYHAAQYYFIGQHPGFGFFTAIPFGMTPVELNTWYYHMGGRELHDELAADFGLRGFLAGNTGLQAGGWFQKEINSAEDFQGLKFRMPGLGGKVLSKLGASVQNIPGAEVYQALSTGAIDGTEWIGPWADEKAGFQEITKIYYTAGYHEPGAGLMTVVNNDVFDSLSAEHQKIIEVASAEANIWNLSQYLANNGDALQRLVDNDGVKTLQFNDDVWDAFGTASAEVIEENMSDPMFKKIYDSFLDSMKKTAGWTSISETAYAAQRNRILGI